MKFLDDWKIGSKLALGASAPLVLLVALGVLSYAAIENMLRANASVAFTSGVMADGNEVIAAAVDMETGMRGYLLAGREKFLEPYRDGAERFDARIGALRDKLSVNPDQIARLDQARDVIDRWRAEIFAPMVALRREVGDAATMNDIARLVRETNGGEQLAAFRRRIRTFVEREEDQLQERLQNYTSAQATIDAAVDDAAERRASVDVAFAVLRDVQGLFTAALDMETGKRGFLLTGDEASLEPFTNGYARYVERVGALEATLGDDPEQRARLETLETIVDAWLEAVVEPAFDLRDAVSAGESEPEAIAAFVGREASRAYFAQMREEVAAFVAAEEAKLAERRAVAGGADQAIRDDLDLIDAMAQRVNAAFALIRNANLLLAAAIDMETGARGYLLAGDDAFLAPFASGRERFDELANQLRAAAGADPGQAQLLQEARQTVERWLADVITPMIELRRQIGDARTMDDMADAVAEARGAAFFTEFRTVMADLLAEEQSLMAERQAASVTAAKLAELAIGVFVIIGLALGAGLAYLIARTISKPITQLSGSMRALAANDLTVAISGTGRGDEIGEMAGTVEVFKQNALENRRLTEKQAEEEALRERRVQAINELIKAFENKANLAFGDLASSAGQLNDTAGALDTTSTQTLQRATTVAKTAEATSASVQTVAASTDELLSSIKEIAQQVGQTNQIAGQASEQAVGAVETVENLTNAANEIGAVIDLIQDIAEQTSLLALNATIESARAGEAGRGFAVVANEVKALASQTSKATSEIAERIVAIQTNTGDTKTSIEGIAAIIADISAFSSTIAAAVEEQGAATREISMNAQQMAAGAGDVSSNIAGVNDTANQASDSASQVKDLADNLTRQSDQLREECEAFLRDVRAA